LLESEFVSLYTKRFYVTREAGKTLEERNPRQGGFMYIGGGLLALILIIIILILLF
jgi:hypothetical protein